METPGPMMDQISPMITWHQVAGRRAEFVGQKPPHGESIEDEQTSSFPENQGVNIGNNYIFLS